MEYNNIFKHPVALIYLLYIYISILNATYYLVTFLPHYVSAVYSHHRYYPAKIVTLYVKITYRVNAIFLN
jgi:hypothetical protein